jgi:hypothetical protein
LSLLSKDGWLFTGIDGDNTQFFIDSNAIVGNNNDISATIISVPDNRGNVFSDFQKLLKEEKKDFTVLRYIEQSWGLNLSQDKYAIYGLIFKSEDGGTIHSINFSAKSITWKFFRDEKIAEKIVLRVSNELDKRKDKEKVEQLAEAEPKETPSKYVIKEVVGVDKENTQTKKTNIETVTFKTHSHDIQVYDIYEHPIGTIEAVKKGWSWPAFFFIWIWALVKKMYVLGTVVCITQIFFSFVPGPIGWVISIGFLITFGLGGNDARRTSLRKRGFELIDTVVGETPDAAVAKFINDKNRAGQVDNASPKDT